MENKELKYLRSVFDYDSKAGLVFWKKRKGKTVGERRFNGSRAGKRAGCTCKKRGYRLVTVNRMGEKKTWLEHRLCFYIHHGWLPVNIDHINRVKDDNRIKNLRGATASQNVMNSNARRDSLTKVKGVYPVKGGGYDVQIQFKKKRYYLGHFKCIEDAKRVRKEKEKELFGEFSVYE